MSNYGVEAAGTWQLGDRVVNRMGFGSMRITVRNERERAVQVLRRAVELGIDHIDTAAFYFSPGGILQGEDGPVRYATELIREALHPYPQGMVVATKVGPDPRADGSWGEAVTAADLRRQVEENLRRLGVETLDLVNLRINRPEDSITERFGALADLQSEGLIRHLGLSNVRIEHLDEVKGIAPVVCVQNAFAVDLRRHDEVLRECGVRGIAFVPFFTIAGPKREGGAAGTEGGPEEQIAARHDATVQQVRLAWTLQQGEHVLVIPGTGDVAHLEENVAAGALRLTDAEMAEIDQRR
ncbi:aldo/keto reductase [Actinoplanes derwentensis]|uniref:Predicted oxidoreductase n=1 Tax=Actinoplanes derwentensis TaxID=113562 RepID=A0A1H2CB14_9ACTN|nr:aldo/keto reductase [Actinoplanes derwentensis]GID89045.1 oxidoreductase [Actinoplanes derwentensis]SDT67457.1 Predicted oxidoreductase [Actinoplanes derwentensis]